MRTSSVYKQVISVMLAAIFHSQGYAQSVSLRGPSCVTTGVVYLYTVSAKWDTAASVRFCVNGGTLIDSGGTCAGAPGILSFVRVMWDSGAQTSPSVTVTTSLGNDSISVTIAKQLNPGQINSGLLNQMLDTLTTPAALTCSAPSDGGCSIAYQYQWQQSLDNVIWQNVSGGTSASLSFARPLSQTYYFRRLTTNTVSNAFGYSNVATLSVPMQILQ